MRSFRPALLLALCVILTCSVLSLQSSQIPQTTASPLKNKDILEMLKAGLTQEIVIVKIKASDCDFDTSPAALKELKSSGVPNAVILAMVQAPAKMPSATTAAPAQQNKQSDTSVASRGKTVYAECGVGGSEISVLTSPGNLPAVATLKCGEKITVLNEQNGWYKVQTGDEKEGYVSHWFISETSHPQAAPANQDGTTRANSTPTSPSASSTLLPNVLRAVAWRAVPWVTTSYYQQPGSADTDCTGSGTWFGNIWQGNTSCTTQYTPAQNVPINWYHYTVYNLVETADSWLVIACTRNWAFSKCSYLIPGNLFPFEYKKGRISITGHKAGKDKEQSVQFDIVSSQPKASR